jgi:hypothetical protein
MYRRLCVKSIDVVFGEVCACAAWLCAVVSSYQPTLWIGHWLVGEVDDVF